MASESDTELAPMPHRCPVWVIAGLLGLQLLAGGLTAASQFVTHDEYWHLPVGLRIWQTGNFEYDHINPPLTRLWGAFPAAMLGVNPGSHDPRQSATEIGLDYLRHNRDHYLRWYVWGRMWNLLWLTATGIILARWAWRWWGETAACLVVATWVFEPTVLGHGSLITPDAGLACWFTLTWYVLWSYTEQPSWRKSIWWGVCCGLAQLCKFTAVLLLPLSLLAWGIWWLRVGRRHSQRAVAGHLATALLMCLCVWNLGYLFSGTGTTWGVAPAQSRALQRVFGIAPILRECPLPIPKPYLAGLDGQQHILESQHPVYLNGVWTVTGFRSYFAWAAVWKLSHGWQWLLLLAAVGWLLAKDRSWSRAAWILAPCVLLVFLASRSGMQLGLRYILPVFPLAALGLGSLVSKSLISQQSRLWSRAVVLGLLALPLGWMSHPQHIAYFNELAGGTEQGGEKLLDSNLDWGQDLARLQVVLRDRQITDYSLAYFGAVPPGELGLRYAIPPRVPTPGWHAVSVNYVYGRPHVLFMDDGTPRPVDLNEFSYFQRFQPDVRVGASILLYEITLEEITARLLGR